MRQLLILILMLCVIAVPAQDSTLSRLEPALRNMEQRRGDEEILVSVSLSGIYNLKKSLQHYHVIRNFSEHRSVILKIKRSELLRLAQMEGIIFISEVHEPKEELTTGAFDLTLNGITYAQSRWPQLRGDSLKASIKERLFDTTDIDLKNRVFKTGAEGSQQTAHASLMATIVAGGSNSSPFARGAAPASRLTSASFSNLFPEPSSIFLQHGISVQNHSYGTVVENFYGNEAAAYDAQSYSIPALLHVFSAGNAGNITSSTGPYAGVNQFANITGNFKQAKNVLVVAAVDSAAALMPLGSKGPAYDGRVKPELVAYGEDGSSGAAATVSGAALLVQQAYKNRVGHLPASALVKAILISSANDVGPPGIDYFSGYGSLNAHRAIRSVINGQYANDILLPNSKKLIPVNVPQGISRIRITLVWTDPEAMPNARKALVNDLDAQLHLPLTGERWQPWVLDPTPDAAFLQQPAQRKKDTLNNVEHITLDNPAAGNYFIEIGAGALSTPQQSFSIAWQMDTAGQSNWTYPSFSDPLIAANIHWLRWETTETGSGNIEYATANGNWRAAGTVTDVSSGYYRWRVPDTITTAVLRMRLSTGTIIMSDTFTISRQLNMETGFNCVDSFLLYWNDLSSGQYELYALGDHYLNAFTTTTDTAIVLKKAQDPSLYYAVAPVINGKRGIRSNTINYTTLGTECYLRSFFIQSQSPTAAIFNLELGTLYGVVEVSLEKQKNALGFQTVQTINALSSTVMLLRDDSLQAGQSFYRVRIRLANGTVLYTNTEVVYAQDLSLVMVYPNPVKKGSPIRLIAKESGRYTIRLFDSNGRLVFQQLITNSSGTLDTGKWPKGWYALRITDRDGSGFTQKLVVY